MRGEGTKTLRCPKCRAFLASFVPVDGFQVEVNCRRCRMAVIARIRQTGVRPSVSVDAIPRGDVGVPA